MDKVLATSIILYEVIRGDKNDDKTIIIECPEVNHALLATSIILHESYWGYGVHENITVTDSKEIWAKAKEALREWERIHPAEESTHYNNVQYEILYEDGYIHKGRLSPHDHEKTLEQDILKRCTFYSGRQTQEHLKITLEEYHSMLRRMYTQDQIEEYGKFLDTYQIGPE